MPGTPQYGGSGGVVELDIGQPGLSRNGETAQATISVIVGDERATIVPGGVPQQNVALEQNLGFAGGQVTWQGSLRVASTALLQTIFAEMAAYKHGSVRINGVLGPPNLNLIKPTRLTDGFGNVISERARLRAAAMTSRVMKISGNALYNFHVQIRIVFGLLG